MKNVLYKIIEKIKTNILYSANFSDKSAVYEKKSKSLGEPQGPQMTQGT
jgi:hypothetical protein